jgi:hypothetical protein
MGHVVLLGDSIFDNARYVPDRLPVIEQLRQSLPNGWQATLLAIDGHIVQDVAIQLRELPKDSTHLVVSAGGNNALGEGGILIEPAETVGEALGLLHEVFVQFRDSYLGMLKALAAAEIPAAVCTIYDSIPGLGPAETAALTGFNDMILRAAFSAKLPVIDLRIVCDKQADYSQVSSIEPSAVGGAKIARVIAQIVTSHDFSKGRSEVYF